MLPPLDLSLPSLHLAVPLLSYRILSLSSAPSLPLPGPTLPFMQLTLGPEGCTLVVGSPAGSYSASASLGAAPPSTPDQPTHPAPGAPSAPDLLDLDLGPTSKVRIIDGALSTWAGISVRGPLDLSMVGVLARISGVLAENEVNLYVCSTWSVLFLPLPPPSA